MDKKSGAVKHLSSAVELAEQSDCETETLLLHSIASCFAYRVDE